MEHEMAALHVIFHVRFRQLRKTFGHRIKYNYLPIDWFLFHPFVACDCHWCSNWGRLGTLRCEWYEIEAEEDIAAGVFATSMLQTRQELTDEAAKIAKAYDNTKS
jgi:hypothetical protein